MKAILEPINRRPKIAPHRTDAAAQPRSFSVDFLRFYATIQVLLIHISAPSIAFMHAKNPWWAACVIDSASRSSVPLFFMISGMLLLEPAVQGKAESISAFLKRRFTKVFLPLISWSLIYISLQWMRNPDSITLQNLNTVLSTPACYHLGFLYVLCGLYLATPILRVFIRHASRVEIRYLVGLWFACECVIPVVRNSTGWNPPIVFQVATGSVGFFVLGYLLRDVRIEKKNLWLAFLILASCLSGIILGTFILTNSNSIKHVDETFFNYSHPLVVVYSALTFVLLRSLTLRMPAHAERVSRGLISSIAAASFTIYLTHPLYLEYLQKYGKFIYYLPGNKFVLTILMFYLLAVITGAVGWLFYTLCKKLKLPAWLVP